MHRSFRWKTSRNSDEKSESAFLLYCLLLLKLIRTGLDVAMGMDGDLEGATISKSV